MGLSEDQKAMLRLLAQRGEQGYEDVAALKGLSVEEVRAQAREAVRQLEDEGLPPPAIPLEPAGPAEPPPQPPKAAEPPPPAPVPAPEPPKEAPPEPTAPPAPPPPPSRPVAEKASGGRGESPRLRLPKDPGARAAIAAGLIAVVALVVVLIVSGGGGRRTPPSTSPETEGAQAGTENSASTGGAKELTQATLSPVGGGEGKGKAIFGRVKNKLALQVVASGLQPTTQSESYTIWIAESPQKMLPLASAKSDKNGRIAAQFEVPTEVLAYLANETFGRIVVSRTSNALLKAALAKATKEKKAPAYTGTHVLEGEVTGPIIGAAIRQEEAEGG